VPRIGTQPLAGLLLGDLPLPADGQTDQPACRGDRFPCSTQEPEPRSRHLHAGHHLASRQAPARLVPEQLLDPGFDVIQAVSTRHQRFASARLRDSHLTRSRRAVSATLTTPALDRRSLRWFATSPCRAATGGPPPSLVQHRSRAVFATSKPSFTFMAHRSHRPRSRGLLAQEQPPTRRGASGRRVKTVSAQHPPDRTGRHPPAETEQLAVDPLVAPSWVLASKPHDQLLQLLGYRRSSVGCGRVGPAPTHHAPVPAQQCLGPHQEHRPTRPREQTAQRREQRTIFRLQVGAVDAGGAAPQARGVTPGSRSPWPPRTGSRAGSAQGCGAAPGRRMTRPHQTSAKESEQATAHRSPSSRGSCW